MLVESFVAPVDVPVVVPVDVEVPSPVLEPVSVESVPLDEAVTSPEVEPSFGGAMTQYPRGLQMASGSQQDSLPTHHDVVSSRGTHVSRHRVTVIPPRSGSKPAEQTWPARQSVAL